MLSSNAANDNEPLGHQINTVKVDTVVERLYLLINHGSMCFVPLLQLVKIYLF